MPGFEHSLLIAAAPPRIVGAFFLPSALGIWWQAARSVTTPRPLGVYAIEWPTTKERDDVLGPLGGVFHGRVMAYRAGEGSFFVADCYWLPPEGDPIGPMALEASCANEGAFTRLRVVQSGCEESLRWYRYYSIVGAGFRSSLDYLKQYLEDGPAAVLAQREGWARE